MSFNVLDGPYSRAQQRQSRFTHITRTQTRMPPLTPGCRQCPSRAAALLPATSCSQISSAVICFKDEFITQKDSMTPLLSTLEDEAQAVPSTTFPNF